MEDFNLFYWSLLFCESLKPFLFVIIHLHLQFIILIIKKIKYTNS